MENTKFKNITVEKLKGKFLNVPTIANIELNLESNDLFKIVLTQNVYLNTVNIIEGSSVFIVFKQDGTGSRTVTFSSQFVFVDGDENTVKADANSISILVGVCIDNSIYCSAIKQY